MGSVIASVRASWQVVLPLCVAALLPGLPGLPGVAAAADGVVVRMVAVDGEPTPVASLTFESLMLNFGGVAAIDENGRVSFVSTLAGDGVTPANGQALWSETTTGLALAARSGDPAPGTSETFHSFIEIFYGGPPTVAGGRRSFNGTLNVPPFVDGIWTGSPGNLSLVVRAGTPTPLGGIFQEPHILHLARTGSTHFTSRVGTLSSIWRAVDGTLTRRVVEGEAALGLPPSQVLTGPFNAFQANDAGRVVFAGYIHGFGTTALDDEGLFLIEPDGSTHLLVREGGPVTGSGVPAGTILGGGGSLSPVILQLQISDDGELLFMAGISGPLGYGKGLFCYRAGVLQLIAATGTPAPGGFGPCMQIVSCHLAPAGSITFVASGPDDDGNPFTLPPRALFSDHGGDLQPALLPGQVIPGTDVILQAPDLHGHTDAGHLAFSTSDGALYLGKLGGTFDRVAAPGELFDVRGDGSDLREVFWIEVGGLAATGEVAMTIHFVGGTGGHFVASYVPPAAFLRGDVNGDAAIDLSDAITLLDGLFSSGGQPLGCAASADVNRSETVNLADAVYLLTLLFVPTTEALPVACEIDASSALSCASTPMCP